jgi:hypothetical protein
MARHFGLAFLLASSFGLLSAAHAQSDAEVGLSEEQWELLEPTVDRAIEYLVQNQEADGSFTAPAVGQPGITSLCSLAILSSGAAPGRGEHGDTLVKAIDFVLDSQQPDGLFSFRVPERKYSPNTAAHAALYNHAMAGLLLTEVYGMTSPEQRVRISKAIPPALKLTREMQTNSKRREVDRGGWKYLHRSPHTIADSDLSVTAWQLMFLRSAKNAEFEVPEEYANDAVEYVKRCFDGSRREFLYGIREPNRYTSRGVVGAGIFALALGGEHDSKEAKLAADRLLKQHFMYNVPLTPYEQYHYTIYHCSQAMFQLGESYWGKFYPTLLKTLVRAQQKDGSWKPARGWDHYGKPYTTALTVLALTPPYQVLPIYQR